MPVLVFHFADLRGESWAWLIRHDGHVVARSDGAFPYYLDALRDARAQGHVGEPHFAKANPDGTFEEGIAIKPVLHNTFVLA